MKKSYKFQKIYYILYVLGFVLLIANEAIAQTLTISGTAPNMTVGTGTAGGALTPVTNMNCKLTYSEINSGIERITVATSTAPIWTITVQATNATLGTAQGAVTLSTTATNFITNIPKGTSNGTCTLTYTLAPTFAQGTGTNVAYRVTYTLQSP